MKKIINEIIDYLNEVIFKIKHMIFKDVLLWYIEKVIYETLEEKQDSSEYIVFEEDVRELALDYMSNGFQAEFIGLNKLIEERTERKIAISFKQKGGNND